MRPRPLDRGAVLRDQRIDLLQQRRDLAGHGDAREAGAVAGADLGQGARARRSGCKPQTTCPATPATRPMPSTTKATASSRRRRRTSPSIAPRATATWTSSGAAAVGQHHARARPGAAARRAGPAHRASAGRARPRSNPAAAHPRASGSWRGRRPAWRPASRCRRRAGRNSARRPDAPAAAGRPGPAPPPPATVSSRLVTRPSKLRSTCSVAMPSTSQPARLSPSATQAADRTASAASASGTAFSPRPAGSPGPAPSRSAPHPACGAAGRPPPQRVGIAVEVLGIQMLGQLGLETSWPGRCAR